jgi:hypothetical protein
MRFSLPLLIAVVSIAGCQRSTTSQSAPAVVTPLPRTTAEGPPPREVKASPTKSPSTPSIPISGIFKPIGERSTDELIAEVEHPNTKDRLPLLAELAKRTKDRAKVLPVAKKQMLDGRYAVRVAAAMTAVAVDPEHARELAVDLNVAISARQQMPVYGPVQESTPELRAIQKTALPGLLRVLESELTAEAIKMGQYQQTGGVLSIFQTLPAEIGKPAIEVVKKVVDTPMHPSRLAADEVLKAWKVE